MRILEIESALKTSEEYGGHWTAFGHLLFEIESALKTSEEYGGHWTAFGDRVYTEDI